MAIRSVKVRKQWEYTARNGAKATDYPWGNEWKEKYANINTTRLAEVGTSPDATLEGDVRDMLGNVSEWTSSKYVAYKGNKLVTQEAEEKGYTVYRGMAYITIADFLKKPKIFSTVRHALPGDQREGLIGFRIVCETDQ